MSLSFEELLEENLKTVEMNPGSLVTGIVMEILENHVVVHVGLKSEATVPINEFFNESGKFGKLINSFSEQSKIFNLMGKS